MWGNTVDGRNTANMSKWWWNNSGMFVCSGLCFSFERHFGNATIKGMSKKNDHNKRTSKGSWQPQFSNTSILVFDTAHERKCHSIQKKVGITVKSVRLVCFTLGVLLKSGNTICTMVTGNKNATFHDFIQPKTPKQTQKKMISFHISSPSSPF